MRRRIQTPSVFSRGCRAASSLRDRDETPSIYRLSGGTMFPWWRDRGSDEAHAAKSRAQLQVGGAHALRTGTGVDRRRTCAVDLPPTGDSRAPGEHRDLRNVPALGRASGRRSQTVNREPVCGFPQAGWIGTSSWPTRSTSSRRSSAAPTTSSSSWIRTARSGGATSGRHRCAATRRTTWSARHSRRWCTTPTRPASHG